MKVKEKKKEIRRSARHHERYGWPSKKEENGEERSQPFFCFSAPPAATMYILFFSIYSIGVELMGGSLNDNHLSQCYYTRLYSGGLDGWMDGWPELPTALKYTQKTKEKRDWESV
jgi:hypothetical protein